MCLLFAATYPERTRALILLGSYARRTWAPDHPWAANESDQDAFIEELGRDWGGPVGLSERAPSQVGNENFGRWWSTYLRMSASPGAAKTLTRINAEIDVCSVLPLVRVPTLIVHRSGDRAMRVEGSRYMAERIEGARYVELPVTIICRSSATRTRSSTRWRSS